MLVRIGAMVYQPVCAPIRHNVLLYPKFVVTWPLTNPPDAGINENSKNVLLLQK